MGETMTNDARADGAANARSRANPSNITPVCYRVNDACQLLSISRSHLYDLASQGAVRMIKIGGRVLVPASEIARLSGMEAAE